MDRQSSPLDRACTRMSSERGLAICNMLVPCKSAWSATSNSLANEGKKTACWSSGIAAASGSSVRMGVGLEIFLPIDRRDLDAFQRTNFDGREILLRRRQGPVQLQIFAKRAAAAEQIVRVFQRFSVGDLRKAGLSIAGLNRLPAERHQGFGFFVTKPRSAGKTRVDQLGVMQGFGFRKSFWNLLLASAAGILISLPPCRRNPALANKAVRKFPLPRSADQQSAERDISGRLVAASTRPFDRVDACASGPITYTSPCPSNFA